MRRSSRCEAEWFRSWFPRAFPDSKHIARVAFWNLSRSGFLDQNHLKISVDQLARISEFEPHQQYAFAWWITLFLGMNGRDSICQRQMDSFFGLFFVLAK
jgi:hypothetical protein